MGDTTRDVRILVVERLIGRLAQQVQQRDFGSAKQTAKAKPLLERLASRVATLRYSYLEDADLAAAEDSLAIAAAGGELVQLLGQHPGVNQDRLTFLGFLANVLAELPQSFTRERSVESIVPAQVGEVLSAERAPKAKNLLLCRVTAFDRTVQIVTNLTDTRKGDRMKVARVPPAEVMGILSEAQFVGRAPLDAPLGERPQLEESEAQEIRRAMGALLD